MSTRRGRDVLNLEQARQVVEAGIRKAEAMGVKVSIAVVNAHGELILLARMDGAIAASPQIAWGKATTAAIFRRRTGDFQQRIQENPAFWAGISVMSGGRMLFGRGGVPIKRGDETIGAVGVSGATSEEDEEIALEAIKQLEK